MASFVRNKFGVWFLRVTSWLETASCWAFGIRLHIYSYNNNLKTYSVQKKCFHLETKGNLDLHACWLREVKLKKIDIFIGENWHFHRVVDSIQQFVDSCSRGEIKITLTPAVARSTRLFFNEVTSKTLNKKIVFWGQNI